MWVSPPYQGVWCFILNYMHWYIVNVIYVRTCLQAFRVKRRPESALFAGFYLLLARKTGFFAPVHH